MSALPEIMDRAMAAQQAGRLPEASALYEQVLAAQPHNLFATHNLGMVRIAQGRLAHAERLIEQAVAAYPTEAQTANARRALGLSLFRAGHWERAHRWLEQALVFFPGDSELLAALHRARPRPHLAPEAFDPVRGTVLRRGTPRESGTYVYAVDVVGTCNLRCPTCPVGNFADARRERGFMPLATFERVLAKIVRERVADKPEVWLFSWGEPLLHPDLPAIIERISASGLESHLSSNLNIRKGLEAVIRARPTSLKISISGVSDETYARTHAGGKLALVLENMRAIRRFLDQHGNHTRVWVGHHIYRSNQHEVGRLAGICAELGFEHHPIAAFYQPLEKLIELAQGRASPDPIMDDMLEHPRDYLKRFRVVRRRDYDCELRYNQTAINFDASVSLCCSVYDEPNMLGANFLEESHEQLEERKYRHPLCATCMDLGLHYAPSDIALLESMT
jgi:MoaA/NifB/PqqE/SkfB family radical SAM enzyme